MEKIKLFLKLMLMGFILGTLTACGGGDDTPENPSVIEKSVSVDVLGDAAVEVDFEIESVSSSDYFVALTTGEGDTVSIFGLHKGTADITVKGNKSSAIIHLTVNATNTLCGEPYLEFYSTMDELRAAIPSEATDIKEFSSQSTYSERISYTYDYVYYEYIFRQGAELVCVFTEVLKTYVTLSSALAYLDQRYKYDSKVDASKTYSGKTVYWYEYPDKMYIEFNMCGGNGGCQIR